MRQRGPYSDLLKWSPRFGGRKDLASLLGADESERLPVLDRLGTMVLASAKRAGLSKRDGLVRETVTWNTGYGPSTEAFVIYPEDISGPLPGVLALHDHGGFKYFGVSCMKGALLIILALASGLVPATAAEENVSTFFVGRLAFGSNDGGDCGDIGGDLVKLVARASTIQVREKKLLKLFHAGELVAVMGEDGLCCSFAMDGSCNAGHGVPPDEAKKIALNICVHALTH